MKRYVTTKCEMDVDDGSYNTPGWIKVYLASDVELLLSKIEENNKKILKLILDKIAHKKE
jgi:hypothetical protein